MQKLNQFYSNHYGIIATVVIFLVLVLETCNLKRKNVTKVTINQKSIGVLSNQVDSIGKETTEKQLETLRAADSANYAKAIKLFESNKALLQELKKQIQQSK